jgi:hypothetical protein
MPPKVIVTRAAETRSCIHKRDPDLAMKRTLLSLVLLSCSLASCASPSELYYALFARKTVEVVAELPDGQHTLHYSKKHPDRLWRGKKWGRGMIQDGEKVGAWTLYHPNGRVKMMTTYKDGECDGLTSYHYRHGGMCLQGMMKNGQQVGNWTRWDYGGKKR